MITIGKVNQDKEGYINIKIDRTSVLGNPFYMKNESMRDSVCERYEKYFNSRAKVLGEFRYEIIRIYNLAKSGKNINLQCWCKPKRCHGDTIKAFLDNHLD